MLRKPHESLQQPLVPSFKILALRTRLIRLDRLLIETIPPGGISPFRSTVVGPRISWSWDNIRGVFGEWLILSYFPS